MAPTFTMLSAQKPKTLTAPEVSQAAKQKRFLDHNPMVDLKVKLGSSSRLQLVCTNIGNKQVEPSSMCLVTMVNDYIEQEATFKEISYGPRCSCEWNTEDQNSDRSDYMRSEARCGLGQNRIIQEVESFLQRETVDETLSTHVLKALYEAEKGLIIMSRKQGLPSRDALLRRSVMNYLRIAGYNAGICKSTRECVGGFPEDEHEYMDVILEKEQGNLERLFVELRFRGQFKVARPTSCYNELLQKLPKVFVGNASILQRIVKLMCAAAKMSLERQSMHFPPWRSQSFMNAKWFSPYTRITEAPQQISSNAERQSDQKQVLEDRNGISSMRKCSRNEAGTAMTDWEPPPPTKTRSTADCRRARMGGALAMALGMAEREKHA